MPRVHIKECAVPRASRPGLPRSGHNIAPLPHWHKDDAIMFGGYVESTDGRCARSAIAESWTYSVEAQTWNKVPYAPGPSPEERLVSQSVVVGDHLWTLGGWNPGNKGDGGRILNDVWKLDLHSYQWQRVELQGEELPRISRFQAVAVGPLIYIHTHRNLQDILVLDTSTDPPTLASKKVQGEGGNGATPSSRGLHSLTQLGDKLYLFGGAPGNGGMLADLWELDLTSLTWKELQPKGHKPAPRCAHAAAALDKYLVFFGGAFYGQKGLEVTKDMFLFDTQETEWVIPEHSGQLPIARNAAAMVNMNGKLLLHGGWRAFVETYDDTFLFELQG